MYQKNLGLFKRALLDQDAESPFVHIFSIGGNNIREAYQSGGRDLLSRQMAARRARRQLFADLSEMASVVAAKPKTALIIIPPMPSYFLEVEHIFELLYKELKGFCKDNNCAIVVRIRDKVSNIAGCRAGLPTRRPLREFYAHDRIHLNSQGNEILAKWVRYATYQISSESMGVKYCSTKNRNRFYNRHPDQRAE